MVRRMVKLWFVGGGMALCLFSLWAMARHDWLRLTRPSRRVEATVSGYRSYRSADGASYAPTYRFLADGKEHVVVDAVHGPRRRLETGCAVILTYPEGRPDLARPPRPVIWAAIYVLLIVMLLLLANKI